MEEEEEESKKPEKIIMGDSVSKEEEEEEIMPSQNNNRNRNRDGATDDANSNANENNNHSTTRNISSGGPDHTNTAAAATAATGGTTTGTLTPVVEAAAAAAAVTTTTTTLESSVHDKKDSGEKVQEERSSEAQGSSVATATNQSFATAAANGGAAADTATTTTPAATATTTDTNTLLSKVAVATPPQDNDTVGNKETKEEHELKIGATTAIPMETENLEQSDNEGKDAVEKKDPEKKEKEEEDDDFAGFVRTKRKKMKKALPPKKLVIQIKSAALSSLDDAQRSNPSASPKETQQQQQPQPHNDDDDHHQHHQSSTLLLQAPMSRLVFQRPLRNPHRAIRLGSQEASLEEVEEDADDDGLEDSLQFFSQTHEEQDPAYIVAQEQKVQQDFQAKLTALDERDQRGRQELEQLVEHWLKEKRASYERTSKTYRAKYMQDEKDTLKKLDDLYREKLASNQGKLNQQIKLYQDRQQKQAQEYMQKHRQKAQQMRMPETHAAAEWQKISQKITSTHQRQLQEVALKGEELKNRTNTDFQSEKEKIRQALEQKQKEVESRLQKAMQQTMQHFGQMRQRYLQRHLQKIHKEREELLRALAAAAASSSSTVQETPGGSTLQSPEAASPKKSDGGILESHTRRDIIMAAMEDKEELRPVSPLKSMMEWAKELSPEELSGGLARHKNRKSLLSQTNKMLSLEIHNEGLWIFSYSSEVKKPKSSDDRDNPDIDEEFVCWGQRAYSILESIVAGEIPHGFEKLNHGDSAISNGAHIRCSVTDFRTSDETASKQRAEAFQAQEESSLAELEKQAAELAKIAHSTEMEANKAESKLPEYKKAVDETTSILEERKRQNEEFKQRFRDYLGEDGNPKPTSNLQDQRELMVAMLMYKNNYKEAVQNERSARQALVETDMRMQRYREKAKAATKSVHIVNALLKRKKLLQAKPAAGGGRGGRQARMSESLETERAAARVKDILAALRITAVKRREGLNHKKNISFTSNWIAAIPNLSMALKKSLWHRMHKRKHQILLRPTQEALVRDLRASVAEAGAAAAVAGRPPIRQEAIDNDMLRAEQLYLLACHPVDTHDRPSVPSSKSSDLWAEPGWLLNLDVPESTRDPDKILPCAPYFPVLDKNLVEQASAPGRQAASFLRRAHLRSLSAPLSAFAAASSPAEVDPLKSQSGEYTVGDPFLNNDDDFESGYSFSLKSPASRQPSQSRSRQKAPKEENYGVPTTAAPAPAASKKLMGSSSERQQRKRQSASKSGEGGPSKRRRESASAKASGSTASQISPRGRKPVVALEVTAQQQSQTQQLAEAQKRAEAKAVAKAKTAEAKAQRAQTHSQAQSQAKTQKAQTHSQAQSQAKAQRSQTQAQPQPQAQSQHMQAQTNRYPSPQQQQRQYLAMMQQRGYAPQTMAQFYNPLSHPNAPSPHGQYQQHQHQQAMSPMRMQGRPGIPHHQSMPMGGASQQGSMQGHQHQGGQRQGQQDGSKDQNDPLHYLK